MLLAAATTLEGHVVVIPLINKAVARINQAVTGTTKTSTGHQGKTIDTIGPRPLEATVVTQDMIGVDKMILLLLCQDVLEAQKVSFKVFKALNTDFPLNPPQAFFVKENKVVVK